MPLRAPVSLDLDQLDAVAGGLRLTPETMPHLRPGESIMFEGGIQPSHDYVVRTPVPEGISREAAEWSLQHYNAPVSVPGYGYPTPTSEKGDVLFGRNPVHYDRQEGQVINYTDPGHMLHTHGPGAEPGKVVNSVVEENGQLYYVSHGSGQSGLPEVPVQPGLIVGMNNGQQAFNAFGGYAMFRAQQEVMVDQARAYQNDDFRGVDRAVAEQAALGPAPQVADPDAALAQLPMPELPTEAPSIDTSNVGPSYTDEQLEQNRASLGDFDG